MVDSGAEMHIEPHIQGWATFEKNFGKIRKLDKPSKTTFVTHDLRNATAPFLTAYKRYFERKNAEELHASVENGPKPLTTEDTIALVEKALAHTYDHTLTENDQMGAYFQEYFNKKLPALRKLYPILKASTLLLDNPTEEGFKDLMSRETDLDTVTSLATSSPVSAANGKLNGVEAIIAFNILNNADRYGEKGSLYSAFYTRQGEVLEISNNSRYAMPPNPFAFGEKGSKSPGIGAGLYISKHLYAPIAKVDVKAYDNGVDVEPLTASVPDAPVPPAHKVQFFMTRRPSSPGVRL